jgi:hypothetical protein
MNRLLSNTPVGIRFADYVFSDPLPLDRFSLPARSAGLYVLLMPDPSWGPWRLQPLFFGEFGAQREVHMTQAQQLCCLRVAAGRTLYFAVYAIPQQHASATLQMTKELIDRYCPVSNLESVDASVGLAYRLDSLEKKIIEQDAVLKLALGAIGHVEQLQPEPRRRIVGFQPDPAGARRGSPGKAQATS